MDIFIQHPQTNHTHAPGGTLPAEGGAPASAISSAGAPVSRAGEPLLQNEGAYRCEKAYDARRRRRRAVLAVLRAGLAIALVPVAVAVVFVGSYAVTCILDGATPEELVQALMDLLEQVKGIVREVMGAICIG